MKNFTQLCFFFLPRMALSLTIFNPRLNVFYYEKTKDYLFKRLYAAGIMTTMTGQFSHIITPSTVIPIFPAIRITPFSNFVCERSRDTDPVICLRITSELKAPIPNMPTSSLETVLLPDAGIPQTTQVSAW